MTERYRPFQEKKQIYALILVFIIMLLALFFLKSFLNGGEDTWICDDGQWIQHGNPSQAKPTTKCE